VHHECIDQCQFIRVVTASSTPYPLRKVPTRKPKSITSKNSTTLFWAIADVPYTLKDGKTLSSRLPKLDANVDFLIHLGDIKRGFTPCNQKALDRVDSIMKLSPVPVLMIVGDNEFNDCETDPEVALTLWRKTFVGYEKKYWTPQFQVHRMPERPEVFYFIHKRAIYFGMNFVGGFVHDEKEWHNRHVDQLNWITYLMMANKDSVDSVILFGQAEPGPAHSDFINPFVSFLRNDFPTAIPILYLCGDSHKWAYEANYKTSNWVKIRLTGGVKEPINRITVQPKRRSKYFIDAFRIERFLGN
jgi:Calcineurin-like phosphoesterase